MLIDGNQIHLPKTALLPEGQERHKGLDLDWLMDPVDGKPLPSAEQMVQMVQNYSQCTLSILLLITVSGKG